MQRASRILYKRVMALVSLFLFFLELPWLRSSLREGRLHLRLAIRVYDPVCRWQLDKWLKLKLGIPPPDPMHTTPPSNFELAAAYSEGT